MKKIFRAKPNLIEAIQLTADSFDEVVLWIGSDKREVYKNELWIEIATLDGLMNAVESDWIIKRTEDFNVVDNDWFKLTYEETKEECV